MSPCIGPVAAGSLYPDLNSLHSSDDFVYEYIGEVIPEEVFRSRIKEYAEEGIEHFYFMMLQKGEVSINEACHMAQLR